MLIKMYSLYLEEHPTDHVKEWLYRDIFLDDFNQSFCAPRSDTCGDCDKLACSLPNLDLNDEARDKIVRQKELHVRKSDRAYEYLKHDIKQAQKLSDIVTIAFDLQQTLPIPYLSHSQAFYLRQLRLYNECVHFCSNNKAY